MNPSFQEKLVDTNGAGDAFVGGFLAALSKGKDMEVLRRFLCPEKWGCQGDFIGEKHGEKHGETHGETHGEKHGESLMILWIFMGIYG